MPKCESIGIHILNASGKATHSCRFYSHPFRRLSLCCCAKTCCYFGAICGANWELVYCFGQSSINSVSVNKCEMCAWCRAHKNKNCILSEKKEKIIWELQFSVRLHRTGHLYEKGIALCLRTLQEFSASCRNFLFSQ